MDQLLIIDDEANLCRELSLFFRSKQFRTHTALSAQEGIRLFKDVRPHYVICDVRLPDASGLDVLEELRRQDPEVYVILITAFQDMETTVQAMRRGAFDYVHKPLDPEELEIIVNKARENRRLNLAVSRLEAETLPGRDFVVGRSRQMLEIYKTIGAVSASPTTVLITGESGTGKELVARAIHRNGSPREPFISVNCSAIVETLLESELFGHERGAFTGAQAQKPGKFELAGKGTIFLDEIGDMVLSLQTKILRVLQEREFTRVGGRDVLHSEARVVAATNRTLDRLVAEGKFREDLYYRLQVITIHVPPLRERREDIPLLVEHFLQKINAEVHKQVFRVPPHVLSQLMAYDWRGNVRELENVLTRGVVLSKGEVLELPVSLSDLVTRGASPPTPLASLQEVEAAHILRVLSEVNWHQGRACEILKVSRPTLRKKIRDYGLKESSHLT